MHHLTHKMNNLDALWFLSEEWGARAHSICITGKAVFIVFTHTRADFLFAICNNVVDADGSHKTAGYCHLGCLGGCCNTLAALCVRREARLRCGRCKLSPMFLWVDRPNARAGTFEASVWRGQINT